MRGSCLSYHVFTVWKWDALCVSFCVCEHFCLSIFSNHYWLRTSKIIATIFFYFQAACKICSKSGSFQEIRICLSIIGNLDYLKRLFYYCFRRFCCSLNVLYLISFIIAVNIMFLLIQKISSWRCDLFHIIFSKEQILNPCISRIIHGHGSYLCIFFIENAAFSVRMSNVLTGIYTIHGSCKFRIALCHISGFLILFYQMNRCTHMLIGKSMGKGNGRFLVIGIQEIKTVHLIRISKVISRCL